MEPPWSSDSLSAASFSKWRTITAWLARRAPIEVGGDRSGQEVMETGALGQGLYAAPCWLSRTSLARAEAPDRPSRSLAASSRLRPADPTESRALHVKTKMTARILRMQRPVLQALFQDPVQGHRARAGRGAIDPRRAPPRVRLGEAGGVIERRFFRSTGLSQKNLVIGE